MLTSPKCPTCSSEYSYAEGALWICPECSHEWSAQEVENKSIVEAGIKDAHGNELKDGDSVSVIKDLKIKGSSLVVKVGTKVKNIRLITEAEDGHDIACRIDGVGAMNLKSQFVKKV